MAAKSKIYLSSADWMERNLDKRVETCFPVEGKKLILRVKKELESYLSDNTQAWVLQSDGRYLYAAARAATRTRAALRPGLLEKLTRHARAEVEARGGQLSSRSVRCRSA